MTQTKAEQADELLAIGPAARLLGVSSDTLRRWENAGLITAVRTLGNQRRFRRSDLIRLRQVA